MKYYQIREFETTHPESHDGVVTEAELKRRILILTGGDYREGDIDIIVNGKAVNSWIKGMKLHKDDALPPFDPNE